MARKNKAAPAERLGLPADYAEFLESLKEGWDKGVVDTRASEALWPGFRK